MAEIGCNLTKAKQLLIQGKLVAIPTETVYGLAANALNTKAVSSIFNVKNRPFFDPLIIHIALNDSLNKYVQPIPEEAKKLIQQFWPGPLTLILKKRDIVPSIVTSGQNTVGVRCVNHTLTNTLLNQLSFPLAAPSANPFGYISPTCPTHVNAQLSNKISYILDGGESTVGIESTIIGFEEDGAIIYRTGGVSQEEIEKIIGAVTVKNQDVSHTAVPGCLKHHYAPHKKMVIGDVNTLAQHFKTKRVGILCFQECHSIHSKNNTVVLSPSGHLEEAAKKLFSALHQLDHMDIHIIIAEKVPHVGIGKAINDRLERASTKL